jgi:hypothetical protein
VAAAVTAGEAIRLTIFPFLDEPRVPMRDYGGGRLGAPDLTFVRTWEKEPCHCARSVATQYSSHLNPNCRVGYWYHGGLALSYEFDVHWYFVVLGGVAAHIVALVLVAMSVGYLSGRVDLSRDMSA